MLAMNTLFSTCFLMGPMNQLKKMFAKTRIIATILVLVRLVHCLLKLQDLLFEQNQFISWIKYYSSLEDKLSVCEVYEENKTKMQPLLHAISSICSIRFTGIDIPYVSIDKHFTCSIFLNFR